MNRKKLAAFLLIAGLSVSQVMMVSATDMPATADNTVNTEVSSGTKEDEQNPEQKPTDGEDTESAEDDNENQGDNSGSGSDTGAGGSGTENPGNKEESDSESTDPDTDDDDKDKDEDKVLEGKWIRSGSRWWYQYSDGTYPKNGICEVEGVNYAFDAEGWMKTGWYLDENTWYYFDKNGAMHRGWILLGKTWYYLNPSDGKMFAEGTYDIGTKKYSFAESGAMRTGWYRDENTWYYFESSGAMHKGWILLGKTWYYLDSSDGKMYADGTYEIGEKSYSFTESGAMRTGWYQDDKIWYYFEASGAMHKGWILLGKTWYYLDPSDGSMHADGISEIKGVKYAFNKSGAMLTGWGKYEDEWYYYDANGAQVKGWVRVGTKWYYLDPEDGKMFSNGMKEIKDETYCFDKSGAMVVGWYQFVRSAEEDPDTGIKHKYNTWYYCTSSGAIKKGWMYLNQNWYYLDPEKGHMYEGSVYEIDGKNYGFGKDGKMATGWYELTRTYTNSETGKTDTYIVKYCFDANGKAYNNEWVVDNGVKYWINEKGIMFADGICKVDKGLYGKFDADGKFIEYVDEPEQG